MHDGCAIGATLYVRVRGWPSAVRQVCGLAPRFTSAEGEDVDEHFQARARPTCSCATSRSRN